MARFLISVLLFNVIVFGQNAPNSIVVDEVGKSDLRIFVVCEYKLVLKTPKDKEVKIFITMMGNGWFAGEHNDSEDFVVSASHLFSCNSTVGELSAKGVLGDIDRSNNDDLSVENIVAMKNSKINNISAYIYDGTPISDIQILFNTSQLKTLNDPDKSLLMVSIPKGVVHTHLPLMEDKIFDEVFYKESVIGKEVVARGFLLYGGGWFLRYRNALIEWIRPEIFQINELLDNGLSGGPVVSLHNGKWYAIGVISHGPMQQTMRNFDMSWITIVKKSFLEKRNKK